MPFKTVFRKRSRSGSPFGWEGICGEDFDYGFVVREGVQSLHGEALRASFHVNKADGPHRQSPTRVEDMEQVELFLSCAELRLNHRKHLRGKAFHFEFGSIPDPSGSFERFFGSITE